MAKIKDNKLIILNSDGIEEECDILFTVTSKETNKNYLVYSESKTNDDGEYYVHAGSFDMSCQEFKIEPIADDKEWDTILNILQTITNNDRI